MCSVCERESAEKEEETIFLSVRKYTYHALGITAGQVAKLMLMQDC